MAELTHFNAAGDAHMVDVGGKAETHRVAVAGGLIRMQAGTLRLLRAGAHSKGDVLGIARVAAIMAAKRTAELVPLCHPLSLSRIEVDFQIEEEPPGVACQVRAETLARTGVEMEALTGVQIALLTIYDMCKSVDRGMVMQDVRLLEKSGGRSGHWQRKQD